MGLAGALAALIVAGPVNLIGVNGGNALTLPAARHLVRLDPQNGKPATWLLAVQRDGSDGHWLGFCFIEYQVFTTNSTPIRLWKSTGAGASWSGQYTFQGHRHAHGLMPDPARHALFAFFGDFDAQSGLYRSTDGGASWTLIKGGTQAGDIVDGVVLADGSFLCGLSRIDAQPAADRAHRARRQRERLRHAAVGELLDARGPRHRRLRRRHHPRRGRRRRGRRLDQRHPLGKRRRHPVAAAADDRAGAAGR